MTSLASARRVGLLSAGRVPAAGLTAAFVALALIPLFLQDYAVGEWTFALAFGVAAVGLNILIADAGLVSLGHNAFVAFGAYATAWLVGNGGMSYLESFVLVAVMALGAAAWFNKISWGWAVAGIVGICLVFGAQQIVTWIRGMFGV